MLSGGTTPYESMPLPVQHVMQVAPTTHFVKLGSAILFRGAGLEVVWPQFLALAIIGTALFAFSLARFRKAISGMALAGRSDGEGRSDGARVIGSVAPGALQHLRRSGFAA